MTVPRRADVTGAMPGAGTQRERHALSQRRPYQWHGIPGWNPAAVLDAWRSAGRMDRQCGHCGARPGIACRNRDGQTMRRAHGGR